MKYIYFSIERKKTGVRRGKMAECLNALVAKPRSPSSIPGTYLFSKERPDSG